MIGHEHDDLTPAERRVRELLHAAGPPQADPEFRARLRQSFLSGHIQGGGARSAAAPRGARPARPDIRAPWQGLPWLRWGLAFASAVVMFFVVVALNQGPAWEVRAISGQGVAVIDGRPVPLDHEDEIARMVRPGSRVRVPDGANITLASAGSMAFEMTAGTDAVVPATPGRWFGRSVHSEVRSGIVRVTTGDRFHGARLTVQTPAADVRVVGTTLAVICEPEGTCVCVLEGAVEVGRRGGPLEQVPEGRRRYVYIDEREPYFDAMLAREATMLAEFRDGLREVLERR